jgi:hypothetical protein
MPVDATERLDCTDLDGYLSHHHDMIILTAMNDARRRSQARERSVQRKWLLDNWSSSRQSFLESLGHRPQLRNPIPAALPSQPQRLLQLSAGNQQLVESIPASMLGTPSFKATEPSNNASGGGNGAAAPEEPAPALPEYLDAHVSAVRHFNGDLKLSRGAATSNANVYSLVLRQRTPIFTSLAEAAATPTGGTTGTQNNVQAMFGLSEADITGYRSLLTMLSYMTGEQRSETVSSRGEYMATCFPLQDFSSQQIHSKLIHSLSFGAKEYLESRFNEKINRFIDENARNDRFQIRSSAEGQGWNTRLSSCLSHLLRHDQLYCNDENVESFAMMYIGSNSISNVDSTPYSYAPGSEVPLWAFVYYALAAGNINAAIDVMAEYGRNNVERTALRVLEYFGELERMFVSAYMTTSDKEKVIASIVLSPDKFAELDECLHVCRTAFETIFAEDDVGRSDPYMLFVLNLLTLTRRDYLANPDFPNYLVENYLWSNLWFAYYSRLLNFAESNSFAQGTSRGTRFTKFVPTHGASER